MTTQDQIIWHRRSIKESKQLVILNKNHIREWNNQRKNSRVFMEMRAHLLQTFRHQIDWHLDQIKWSNEQIQKLQKNTQIL